MHMQFGRSLDQEDPLEKGIATHSRILAWKIPWTEKPGGLQSMELQRVGHSWATELNGLEKEKATHFSILAWKIPWTEKPGRLQSMGSQRVGHDWLITHTKWGMGCWSDCSSHVDGETFEMFKFHVSSPPPTDRYPNKGHQPDGCQILLVTWSVPLSCYKIIYT